MVPSEQICCSETDGRQAGLGLINAAFTWSLTPQNNATSVAEEKAGVERTSARATTAPHTAL